MGWETQLSYTKGRVKKFSTKITQGAHLPKNRWEKEYYDPNGMTFHLVTGGKLLAGRSPVWGDNGLWFTTYLDFTPVTPEGIIPAHPRGHYLWDMSLALAYALGNHVQLQIGTATIGVAVRYRADKNQLRTILNCQVFTPLHRYGPAHTHLSLDNQEYVPFALEAIGSRDGTVVTALLDRIAEDHEDFRHGVVANLFTDPQEVLLP